MVWGKDKKYNIVLFLKAVTNIKICDGLFYNRIGLYCVTIIGQRRTIKGLFSLPILKRSISIVIKNKFKDYI